MKKYLFIILDAIMKIAIAQLDEVRLESLLQEWAKAWVEKHLTAEEIKNEVNDFGKLIRKVRDKL